MQELLDEFRANPVDKLSYEEFDLLVAPMLNDTRRLFSLISDQSNQINFYEVFIVLVLFCRHAEYEERLALIFGSFDLDNGGQLDRRELSVFISAAIFGLCKVCGIPLPSKLGVSNFITEQFRIVDEDGSGVIEFSEFENWLNGSRQIQDFILRYTGVQTIIRARDVYNKELEYWRDLFERISVEYYGRRFVEMHILQPELEKALSHIELESKKKLVYLLTYNGDQIIEQSAFDKIMQIWASFSANDINNDNELDVTEI